MTLKEQIDKWLMENPHATNEQAIWAGAKIEIDLWCNKTRK